MSNPDGTPCSYRIQLVLRSSGPRHLPLKTCGSILIGQNMRENSEVMDSMQLQNWLLDPGEQNA
jgi:hypothetical protein